MTGDARGYWMSFAIMAKREPCNLFSSVDVYSKLKIGQSGRVLLLDISIQIEEGGFEFSVGVIIVKRDVLACNRVCFKRFIVYVNIGKLVALE